MKNLITTILFFISINIYAQKNIIQFQFTSFGRGYQESILIRRDSIFINIDNRMKQYVKEIHSILLQSDWEKLINSILEFKLTDLEKLPAPSDRRANDAAYSENIIIKTEQREYNCGEFDSGNPNAKLKHLMEVIFSIRKKLVQ